MDALTGSISAERHLTMAALSGLIALRMYCAGHPTVTVTDAISTLRTQFFDTAHFDYNAALDLDASTPDVPLAPADRSLQALVAHVIRVSRPWWLRLFPLGRERVFSVLTDDQLQCFASAGLTATQPDQAVIAWWDAMAGQSRREQDDNNLAKGRIGEQLTLEHEVARLARLGIDRKPRWIALDNSTLGYDVLSFDRGPVEPTNRLIEVKASSTYPLTFHVTGNEWDIAREAGSSYVFHVWHMPTKRLYTLSPNDLTPHIPVNQGWGKWESTVITIPDESAKNYATED